MLNDKDYVHAARILMEGVKNGHWQACGLALIADRLDDVLESLSQLQESINLLGSDAQIDDAQ